jgi:hypothetical protein
MDGVRGGEGLSRAAAAPLASRLRGLAPGLLLARPPIEEWVGREVAARRLFPWLAVAFGLGILLYFRADREPALWAPLAGLALALAAAWRARAGLAGLAACLFAAGVLAGFAAGALRTRAVDAPALARTLVAPLEGFVESIDERPEGGRLLVRVHRLGDLDASIRPRRVRVTVRDVRSLSPGDFVVAQARLPAASRGRPARRLRLRPGRLLPGPRRGGLGPRAGAGAARPARAPGPGPRVGGERRRGPQRADAPHRRGGRRAGGGGGGGPRHWQARAHHRGDQRRVARRRDLPRGVDLRPSHGAGGGRVLLDRPGAPRAPPPGCPCSGP